MMITTEHLSLGYQQPIVTHINLNIEEGEFIGIFGSNGSGKSTFLKTVLGLIKPLSGNIFVLNTKPSYGNRYIGYMPQTRSPISITNLTARALLEISYDGMHYGLPLPSKNKQKKIDQVLEIVKAYDFAEHPFHQLSGGEKQRIFLAQALLNSAKILLLDEPLANLDPHYQEVFIQLLQQVQQNFKMTILLTAHDPNPLLPAMNRVLFFAKGKAIIGTIDEIMTSTTLSALYETSIEVIRLNHRLFVLGDGQNILGEIEHHHG